MQAAQRASRNAEEEVNKRKEKERKREEKELRKIAKAAGVKMVKPAAPTATTPAGADSSGSNSSGFKKSGWATVTALRRPANAFGMGFRRRTLGTPQHPRLEHRRLGSSICQRATATLARYTIATSSGELPSRELYRCAIFQDRWLDVS